jgi:hypothetical protein
MKIPIFGFSTRICRWWIATLKNDICSVAAGFIARREHRMVGAVLSGPKAP